MASSDDVLGGIGEAPAAATPPEETPTVHRPPPVPSLRAEQLAPGTILGERWRVVSLLGRGGMGDVYRADDLGLGQPVALKFLAHRTAAGDRDLKSEVRIGRQVAHPNVCRLYDLAEVGDRIFIAMEYVDGEDLASLLRRIGRLPSDKALRVARELCEGVAAAHELGIVHRDLKPGNVMIDGRGRVRITDFGLAVPHDASNVSLAGTPAYMAPEQLGGEAATVRSDLYALGLVLYEIVTGRRAQSGSSVAEIIAQQRERRLARPSAIAADVDPRIEQAILHCLEADPELRPQSVRELIRELPSFDPLSDAVAAGETPSPAMVAAASERGDLTRPAAWAMLAIAVVAAAGTALLAGRVTIAGRAQSIRPPDVLLERTREGLAEAGVDAAVRDSAWYFLPAGGEIRFVYRSSTAPMTTRDPGRILGAHDPPLSEAGMVSVSRETGGALLEFAVVPPRRDAPLGAGEAEFSALIEDAGFDLASLRAVAPEFAAPVDSDAKRAWVDPATDRRIEAASYHGKPVWFAVLDPADLTSGGASRTPARAAAASDAIYVALLTLIPIVVFLLALRHIRQGRGDRPGATRLALAMFATLFLAFMLRTHHVPDFRGEWEIVLETIAMVAWWSAVMWLAYVALEPLVRRRWPKMLIGWSRLLQGRWRDPIVGRDVLIGCAAGALIALSAHATGLLGEEPLPTTTTTIGSMRQTIFYVLLFAAEGVGRAIFAAVLVVGVRALVRRLDAAVAISVFLIAVGNLIIPGGPMWLRLAWSLLAGVAVYAILFRYGLLALAVTAFAALILRRLPLTLDTNSWTFGESAIVYAIFGALAFWAFWRSLGGKSPLPSLAVE